MKHVKKELCKLCCELALKKPEKNDADSELEVNRQISQAIRCLAKFYPTAMCAEKATGFELDELFASKQFWKLSRHKDSAIRAAFFQLGMVILEGGGDSIPSVENWSKAGHEIE